MALTTIAVNGVPIEDYLLWPIDLERWLQPPTLTYGSVELLGQVGSVATVRGRSYRSRDLTIAVMTRGANMVASRDLLRAWYKDTQGLVEIESIDAPGKVCYGVFENATDGVDGVKLLSPNLTSIGTLVCRDPLWYARAPITISAAAATRVAVPGGSASGRYRFLVIGACTNPTVTLRSRTGEILAVMRFTATLGATEAIEVDPQATRIVTRWTAGVGIDAFDTLNVVDLPFRIDPLDEPTIETDVGSLMLTTWIGDLT